MHVIKDEGSRPIKAWVSLREDTLNKAHEDGHTARFNSRINAAGDTVMVDVPDIEAAALTQLKNLARLPFIASNGVAVMPDVHAGKGSTIGSVIATEKAIIPSAVGVDIGCGMVAVRLSLRADQLPDSLARIRDAIEKAVPVGNGSHTTDLDARQESFYKSKMAPIPAGVGRALGHVESIGRKSASQLGTLGSGNHFIELCLDEEDRVWIMLHSGSRGVGNMIGTYFIEKAKKRMEQYFITLPDGDLAYLPEDTDDFNDYMEAVGWAQNYAFENRREMMAQVLNALSRCMSDDIEYAVTSEAINCHHNYVERENHFGRNMWVTRKGAIRARQGDLGIIPGSMGQKSYIVRGKGNIESYCSCSHGAGRAMSRTEARRRFSLTDLVNQTNGVECRKDDAVLDEIPTAYKDLDLVMKNQEDLIEVVHALKAVLCVKGS